MEPRLTLRYVLSILLISSSFFITQYIVIALPHIESTTLPDTIPVFQIVSLQYYSTFQGAGTVNTCILVTSLMDPFRFWLDKEIPRAESDGRNTQRNLY